MLSGNVYGPVKPLMIIREFNGIEWTSTGERSGGYFVAPGSYNSSLMVMASASCGADAIEYARGGSLWCFRSSRKRVMPPITWNWCGSIVQNCPALYSNGSEPVITSVTVSA